MNKQQPAVDQAPAATTDRGDDPPPQMPPAAPSGGGRRRIGLPGCCPSCRAGDLFAGPFTIALRRTCDRCSQDYTFADAGDGPAIFAIFILGVVILGGALIAEFKFGVPVWGHVLLWGLLTPLAALLLLRGLKSWLIASQFKHKAGEIRGRQT